MSCIELCRVLRSRPDTKMLPTIILSARGEESDRTLGLDTGADDYISKPFSPRELVSRVKALLRRSRPALTGDVLEFADVSYFQNEWRSSALAICWRWAQRNFIYYLFLLSDPVRCSVALSFLTLYGVMVSTSKNVLSMFILADCARR